MITWILIGVVATLSFVSAEPKFNTPDGFTADDFQRMYHSTQNVRTRLFLNICQDCYLEYQRYLKENNAVDFEDMINESARLLREVKDMKKKLDFKYIIVDEYQDISRQRFDLVSALSEVTEAKIIAVGDDWQSIYAFSGSDITLFTRFLQLMGAGTELKITHTYRNSQELIDIAGGFVQKNSAQIRKQLLSPKHLENPIVIEPFDDSVKMMEALSTKVEEIIGKILDEFGAKSSILLIDDLPDSPNIFASSSCVMSSSFLRLIIRSATVTINTPFLKFDVYKELKNIKCPTFIIGGSYGLDEEIKKISNYKLSFSKMTFPHQLFRLLFLEQLYRSYKIMNNEEYHK